MVYKHLHYAFLFEAVIGLLSLLTVIVFGKYGVFLLVLLSIRPLVLQRDKSLPDATVWRLYFRAFVLAVLLTAVSIVVTFLVVEMRWYEPEGARYLPLLALPWFVLAHGLGGYFLSNSGREK